MVEVRNVEVWAQFGQPSRLVNALRMLNSKPVSVGVGLKLRRITRCIDQHIGDLEAEYQRIIELYAEKDGDGQPARDEQGLLQFGDNDSKATEQFNELMVLTFEVDAIKASEIEKVTDLPASVLIDLGDLLVDDLSEVTSTNGSKPPKKKR